MTAPIRPGVASVAPTVQPMPDEDESKAVSDQVVLRNSIPGAHPSGSVNSINSGRGTDAAADPTTMNSDIAFPTSPIQSPSQNPIQQILQLVMSILMQFLQMLGLGQQQQDPTGVDPMNGTPAASPGPTLMSNGLDPTGQPGTWDPSWGLDGAPIGNQLAVATPPGIEVPTGSWDPTAGILPPDNTIPLPSVTNLTGANNVTSTTSTTTVTSVANNAFPTGANVPEISQYSPAGSQFGYSNGIANCGPTSVAMICRSMGLGQGMTDAQYINQLGAIGGTTGQGSSINGIVAMAQSQGLNAEIHGPTADLGWIDSQLSAGHDVVANGDWSEEPGHAGPPSGHFLDVVGKDSSGDYLVRDPSDASEQAFTPDQLATFINSNQDNGGYCVAISQ